MRIRRTAVSASAKAVLMRDPKMTRRRAVGSQIVREQILWQDAKFLQNPAHQFQRSGLIPLCLNQRWPSTSIPVVACHACGCGNAHGWVRLFFPEGSAGMDGGDSIFLRN
jgi:hypothetical protein